MNTIDPNMGVGATSGVEVPPASVVEMTPEAVAVGQLSTLSPSDAASLEVNLYANSPSLAIVTGSSSLSGLMEKFSPAIVTKFVSALISTYNETINAMLDAWNKNVKEVAEANKEAAAKSSATSQRVKNELIENNTITEGQLHSAQIAAFTSDNSVISDVIAKGNYLSYLMELSPNMRAQELHANGSAIVDNYIQSLKRTDPRNHLVQNQDLTKAIMPMLLLQTFVVAPLSAQLVLTPSDKLGDLSSYYRTDLSQGLQPQDILHQYIYDPTVLTINLMVMAMSVQTTLALIQKQQQVGTLNVKVDSEYVNQLAKNVLRIVNREKGIEGMLAYNNPAFDRLAPAEKQSAVVMASLFLMANVLMLNVRVQGGKLQEAELRDILLSGKGIPDTETELKEIRNSINSAIVNIPSGARSKFVESLLHFIELGSMFKMENFTNLNNALALAFNEITHDKRLLLATAD